MNEEKFTEKYFHVWKKLESFNLILHKKGLRGLQKSAITDFASAFKKTSYHLAYAKTHYPESETTYYLNAVVAAAHNFYYVREKSGFAEIKHYLLSGFPSAFYFARKYIAVSAAIFFAGAVLAHIYVSADPQNLSRIVPGTFDGSGGEWDYPLMSAYVMTNNIRVAGTLFATGLFGGIGTVLILLYNGAIIGALNAFAAVHSFEGFIYFYSLILPHGIIELLAIYICGACGLMLGKSLLIPGKHKRKDAVIKAAKDAGKLIPGIILMLVVAGLIEGFFTPLSISPWWKITFAAVSAAALIIYLSYQKHIAPLIFSRRRFAPLLQALQDNHLNNRVYGTDLPRALPSTLGRFAKRKPSSYLPANPK
ncbi:MAG: stage II sporulation protein M [Defluviitaleaceae bacterium]|nr:stage II sporulation protein M [Defluviitaleaceae bacterium]